MGTIRIVETDTFTRRIVAALGAAVILFQPLTSWAAVADFDLDGIIGQPNAVTGTPNTGGVSASSTYGSLHSAFDANGNLFLADTYNHRVLIYLDPMNTDHVADFVIGQPDFNSNVGNNGGITANSLYYPGDVAFASNGDLYVADSGNSRVLCYDNPLTNDRTADRVFGQPNFTSNAGNNGGLGAGSLSSPWGVAVDSADNLWVADTGNHRVLEYNNPPVTGDRIADFVIGQPNFTSNTWNNGGVSASSLYTPIDVAVDTFDGVWVADSYNSRVLQYDEPLVNGRFADRILGQPNFSSAVANYSGVNAYGLALPYGVSVDANGNVYVADTYNHRVLLYTSPVATSDRVADRVFGQPDFNSNTPNNGGLSASTMYYPSGTSVDLTGNVAVTDYYNCRTTLFEAPVPLVTSISFRRSPATGKVKIVIEGYGMVAGSAVISVNGTPLANTKFKLPQADGTARKIQAVIPNFDATFPPSSSMVVSVANTGAPVGSAPLTITVPAV
jgi:sugar lactone lactonase YvrE